MFINGIKNISPGVNFKGYDAAPLKTLYMEDFNSIPQAAIFRQLQEIGKKENFTVAIQDASELRYDIVSTPIYTMGDYWAQDDKIIIREGGKNKILKCSDQENKVGRSVDQLGKLTGMDVVKPYRTSFEGGNVFLGKKGNGEPYVLAGESTLLCNCANLYNEKEFNGKKDNKNFVNRLTGKPTADFSQTVQNKYKDEVLENIAKTFGVNKKNIFFVPQVSFHIDMFLRPLGFPYVLINNPEMAIQNLENLQNNSEGRAQEHWGKLLKETKQYYNDLAKEDWARTEGAKEKLIEQGFIPIEIGGIYDDRGGINFMNAVVNKRPDGTLGYITNSAQSNEPLDLELEKLFTQQLKEKFKNVKNVHFVFGVNNWVESGVNSMRVGLMGSNGGLHCKVCEEPNFDMWG